MNPTPPPTPHRGFVARCSVVGDVVEVLADPEGLLADRPGVGFLELLDEGSRSKGAGLLDRARDQGAAFGWELLLDDGAGTPLRFTAVEDAGELLLIGSPLTEDLEGALSGLAGVNNQVLNRLRELEAEQARVGEQLDDYGTLNGELVNLHRELARRTAQLEQANEQKNQLIGMAAHDLRNPIGAIRGFAQLLLSRISDRLDDRELMVLQRIERSSDHMLDLVNDLLQLAEVDRAGLQVVIDHTECDLVELVRQTVEVEGALAEQKGIRIELAVDGDELPALLDEPKIEQVVANLLSNAVKFSDPGTTVTVAVHRDHEVVVLEVCDEGPGIPDEDRSRIFEPFARASVRPTGGERSTGLGLAIVHRIVEGHGGRIEVDTAVGVGSTFRVVLPRTPDTAIDPA